MYEDNDINNTLFNEEVVSAASEVFSMLADITRIKIILALSTHGELAVGTLAKVVNRRPPSVSQHLAKMRMLRIVLSRQEGTTVYYRLADEHASALVREALHQAEHTLIETSQIPGHHIGDQ
ncbi:ArsR/SmtB family transcription factor [Corynebacterium kutscheri]|nr:metalloregulator ArsR/SmtB family transcription factor [Corynebacterium kutscheri]